MEEKIQAWLDAMVSCGRRTETEEALYQYISARFYKPAPLRVLEYKIEPPDVDNYVWLNMRVPLPTAMSGKRVRCVIEEVG